jgi:hypothetical protein
VLFGLLFTTLQGTHRWSEIDELTIRIDKFYVPDEFTCGT